ncbi:MAG TPA: ChaB family protein [Streptosporangiaceae bacterium]
MPKMTRGGEPDPEELPGTLLRSPKKAQDTFAQAHDSALQTYGDEQRASRVAWGAVKHMFEKVGDRWEYKDHKGPSDPRPADPQASRGRGATFGGVDYLGHTKAELYERAAKLGVRGRSKMSKADLAHAIARQQD